jgi:DNA-binding transcriptional regulator YiaG
VEEKIEEKFNNYLLENINHFMKTSTQYSNCELFSENNIKSLRNTYHISFDFITEYLNYNNSIKGIIYYD